MSHATDDRAVIFSAIKAALAPLPAAKKTPLPDYDLSVTVAQPRLTEADAWNDFARNLKAVNGRFHTSVAELAAWLQEKKLTAGYCDPALRAEVGEPLAAAGIALSYTYERARVDELSFGVTPATGAVAETGSIILTDRDTPDRLAALAPWAHIAVLRRSQLKRTLAEAIAHLPADPNVIFCTGPSKTADVEGILIEGVHGPGEQVALVL